MEHMHGYLRLMESLMALDDWAQERRVRLCLEGPTEVQFPDGEKKGRAAPAGCLRRHHR
jgi:hypothetical protein